MVVLKHQHPHHPAERMDGFLGGRLVFCGMTSSMSLDPPIR
jgi:hypothetical protein